MNDQDYLESVKKQFQYYKMLGDKTFALLNEQQLFWQFNDESNSITIIIKHLSGNMLSRWTELMSSDGEKDWRNRDAEFENEPLTTEALLALWEKGWACLFGALNALTAGDLEKVIYIRNQGHTVMEAINRQLAHYPYHVGQIVYIGKMLLQNNWQSLSIPRGKSNSYNAGKFAKPKEKKHFTDDYLDKDKE